ncbi:MAG: hypothetical protein AAGI53_13640 [Planctomycetota bacterium]
MRMFWIVFTVVVVGGLVWMFAPSGSGATVDGPVPSAVAPSEPVPVADPAPVASAVPSAEADAPTESVTSAALPADGSDGSGVETAEAFDQSPVSVEIVDSVVAPVEIASVEDVASGESVEEVDSEFDADGSVDVAGTESEAPAESNVDESFAFGSLIFTPETVAPEPEREASDVVVQADEPTESQFREAAAVLARLTGVGNPDGAAASGRSLPTIDELLSPVTGAIAAFTSGAGAGDLEDVVDDREKPNDASLEDASPETGVADAGLVADEPAVEVVAIDSVSDHPDGGLEVGGRWRIPGSGTAEDPYIMRWDVLQSAMQIYNPRLGQTEPPSWTEAFNGKRVLLEGYVVLPLAQQTSTEILLTLNQWDGCCIGVPPTPYDAIEVSLNQAVEGTAHIGGFYYGQLEGTFKFDPYLAGGWLLGLYLMDDAVLKSFAQK